MSLFKQFGTDTKAENDGVWIEMGLNEDGSEIGFLIARASKSNKRYTKALEKATKPHRTAMATETLEEKVAAKLMLDVFCEAVLLGWRNVRDRDDKEIAHNKANAIQLMQDLPELYERLSEESKKLSLFREKELEADAKN